MKDYTVLEKVEGLSRLNRGELLEIEIGLLGVLDEYKEELDDILRAEKEDSYRDFMEQIESSDDDNLDQFIGYETGYEESIRLSKKSIAEMERLLSMIRDARDLHYRRWRESNEEVSC